MTTTPDQLAGLSKTDRHGLEEILHEMRRILDRVVVRLETDLATLEGGQLAARQRERRMLR